MKKVNLLVLAGSWVLALGPVPALGALDDALFSDATDVTATEDLPSLLTVFEETRPLKLSGTTEVEAGYVYGWKDLGESGSHGEGLLLTQTFALSARPLRNLSSYASFEATYPTEPAQVTLKELYVDTTVLNLAYLRVGKTSFNWETAKIFDGLVDLASDSSEGLSARLSVPWKGGSVVGYVVLPTSSLDLSKNASFQTQGFDNAIQAARLNVVGSGFDVYAAWRHRWGKSSGRAHDTDYAVGAKTSLVGVDLFADALVQVRQDGGLEPRYSGVLGFFYEAPLGAGVTEKVQVYAEHQYDQRAVGVFDDHQTSAVVKFTGFGKNHTEFGVQWSGSWRDQTNEVLFGCAFDADDGLRVELGLPWLFGPAVKKGVYYVEGVDYQLALGAKATVTLTY